MIQYRVRQHYTGRGLTLAPGQIVALDADLVAAIERDARDVLEMYAPGTEPETAEPGPKTETDLAPEPEPTDEVIAETEHETEARALTKSPNDRMVRAGRTRQEPKPIDKTVYKAVKG